MTLESASGRPAERPDSDYIAWCEAQVAKGLLPEKVSPTNARNILGGNYARVRSIVGAWKASQRKAESPVLMAPPRLQALSASLVDQLLGEVWPTAHAEASAQFETRRRGKWPGGSMNWKRKPLSTPSGLPNSKPPRKRQTSPCAKK